MRYNGRSLAAAVPAPGEQSGASVPGRGALAVASAAFAPVAMPDAEYVGSTTKITWTNFSGTVLTDGVLTVTFNRHVHWSQVPTYWMAWSSPPLSEESEPHVMQADYINTDEFPEFMYTEMRLSQPVTTFGFELEPQDWAWVPMSVSFYSGDSLIGRIDELVNGQGGARLFAARSPEDRPIDRVMIHPNGTIAFAQLRYALDTPPSLSVACTPNPVVRGAPVRCAATVSPSLDYTVVRRRARTAGADSLDLVDENPSAAVAAGGQYVWEGQAVTSTAVLIAVDVVDRGGTMRHLSHEATYGVSPRSWPVPQLAGPTAVTYALAPAPDGTMTPYPSNGVLGQFGPDRPIAFFSAVPIRRPTEGPNQGLGFVADSLTTGGFTVWLHPGLQSVPQRLKPGQPGYQPWHQWHDDQNGKGSGTCTKSVWSILDPEVRRHEGATRATNSHWGVAAQAYRDLGLADSLERVYTSDMDGVVRDMEYNAWFDFHNTAAYRTRHTQFDVADTAVVNQKLGCWLDYNPNDQ